MFAPRELCDPSLHNRLVAPFFPNFRRWLSLVPALHWYQMDTFIRVEARADFS